MIVNSQLTKQRSTCSFAYRHTSYETSPTAFD